MKKLLIALIPIVAVFMAIPTGLTSCTKTIASYDTTILIKHDTTLIYGTDTLKGGGSNSVSSPYYISAIIDSDTVIYSNYTAAFWMNPDVLDVYGFNSPAIATDNGIHLHFESYAVGAYSGVGVYPDTSARHSLLFTLQRSGKEYQNFSTPSIMACTIIAIDSATISGTFSGTVTFLNVGTPVTITNGRFYVPF